MVETAEQVIDQGMLAVGPVDRVEPRHVEGGVVPAAEIDVRLLAGLAQRVGDEVALRRRDIDWQRQVCENLEGVRRVALTALCTDRRNQPAEMGGRNLTGRAVTDIGGQ